MYRSVAHVVGSVKLRRMVRVSRRELVTGILCPVFISVSASFLASCAGGGQSGDGPGAYECTRHSECDARAEALLEDIDEMSAAVPLTNSECVPFDPRTGTGGGTSDLGIGRGDESVCHCATADGSVGYYVGLRADGCEVHGAKSRKCLSDAAEFSGCAVDDPRSCAALCDELSSRLEEDVARDVPAAVRFSQCVRNSCKILMELDGQCYVNNDRTAHDCSLGDDIILSTAP